MEDNTALKFTTWKENFLEKDKWVLQILKNCQITAYVLNTREFFMFLGKYEVKETRKVEYNFGLGKIGTIVDVKRQKQPPRGVLKTFVEVFRKLNGFLINSRFFSFRIFH